MNAQTEASFSSSPSLLDMAMTDKYVKSWNFDKTYFRRLFRYAPLRCSEENIQLVSWTRKQTLSLLADAIMRVPEHPSEETV